MLVKALNILKNIDVLNRKTLSLVKKSIGIGEVLSNKYGFPLDLIQVITYIVILEQTVDNKDIVKKYFEVNIDRINDVLIYRKVEELRRLMILVPEKLSKISYLAVKCISCHINDFNIMTLPCGHILYCRQCYPILSHCTKCNYKVEEFVNIYL